MDQPCSKFSVSDIIIIFKKLIIKPIYYFWLWITGLIFCSNSWLDQSPKVNIGIWRSDNKSIKALMLKQSE